MPGTEGRLTLLLKLKIHRSSLVTPAVRRRNEMPVSHNNDRYSDSERYVAHRFRVRMLRIRD